MNRKSSRTPNEHTPKKKPSECSKPAPQDLVLQTRPTESPHEADDETASVNRRSVMTGWFLGPKAEHSELWQKSLEYIFQDYIHWRRNYFPTDPVIITRERRRQHEEWIDRLNGNLDAILNRLKGHFPFYSPRYIAHMLSEQTLPSILGYFAGMLYNPNNVTDEAAPITVKLELEAGQLVAEMLGFNPKRSWTHICSGGTIANLEALWVARMVQFVPFIVRDFCSARRLKFLVKTPSQIDACIVDLSDKDLIRMKPVANTFMIRNLAKFRLGGPDGLKGSGAAQIEVVLNEINQFARNSKYNIRYVGFHEVIKLIGMTPTIFASASAHYSIAKAASVLGYGERCVRNIPVGVRFRINDEMLRNEVFELPKRQYIAAVVGIVGTTEEGAVDPIHKIKAIRDELQAKNNSSFWLHIDAAWGGYIRSLFCGHDSLNQDRGNLDKTCAAYVDAIAAAEDLSTEANSFPAGIGKQKVTWDEFDLYKAFLAIADADSVTIDPHKMGYIPYPAGMVSFRNGAVTELLEQKAQYISDIGGFGSQPEMLDDLTPVPAVGPYILEGSKPGAAAAACWLAHKTIPLTIEGHGKIVKTTLLNARRLVRYLSGHKSVFERLNRECFGDNACPTPFLFHVLSFPDTNIVIFVTVPATKAKEGGGLNIAHTRLSFLNQLNQRIYESLSLRSLGTTISLPYSQPYFVSRTWLRSDQYDSTSMQPYFEKFVVDPESYKKEGLFVLRSTVMNPFYFAAREVRKDYLYDFVKQLHMTARRVLGEINAEQAEAERRSLHKRN